MASGDTASAAPSWLGLGGGLFRDRQLRAVPSSNPLRDVHLADSLGDRESIERRPPLRFPRHYRVEHFNLGWSLAGGSFELESRKVDRRSKFRLLPVHSDDEIGDSRDLILPLK